MNGEGSENPTWLFLGEAPGENEDEEGTPFIGEAGGELRQGIEDVGIPIDKCRFDNVVKCRPPNNNLKKFPKAIEHCRPHILRVIRATNPKVVVLLGNSAIASLLNKTGILKLHGQVINIGRLKFICMFHPAYLLRNNTPATRKSFLEALRTAKRAASSEIVSTKRPERTYLVPKDRRTLQECVDIIKKSEYPATDVESTTLSPFSARIVPKVGCIGVAHTNNDSIIFPVSVRTGLEGCKLPKEEVLEAVKEVWEDKNLKWLAHNGKHDMAYVYVLHKILLGGKGHKTGVSFDTMLASYALDHRKGIHGLDDWAVRAKMPDYYQPLNQYKIIHPEADPNVGGNLLLVPADILYPYNGDDCICTRRIFFQQRKLLKEQKLWDRPFMFPLMYESWIATMMEITGINIDQDRNKELDGIYRTRLDKIDKKLYSFPEVKKLQKMADMELLEELYLRVKAYKRPIPNPKKKVLEFFKRAKEKDPVVNLNSPDEKRRLVFEILDYEPIEMTESGLPSTEKWILEDLNKQERHPVLSNIIKRGTYQSAYNKYIGPVLSWVGTDGRSHTRFKIHGTDTGRPSSEDPNHLNLPARSELAGEIMSQFVSRGDGYWEVKQDSKQIELRLIADRAHDEVMIQEFNDGKDPHAMGAQAAYHLTEAQWAKLDKHIQKKLRSICKNAVSFGLVYGRLAAALALDFGWSVRKAQKFIDAYFTKYHGIWDYLQERKEYILNHGFVRSSYGRIRRLPDVDSDNEGRRNAAIREGINTDIQGDASDINFVAAYRMERWLQKYRMKTRVNCFVYDAVYLDAWHKELQDVIPQLHHYMTDRDYIEKMTGWRLGVPLDTDCAVGINLGPQMQELEHTKTPGQFIIDPKFL